MKGLLGLLRVVVVGFAVVAGGRALYRNRDRLASGWREFGDLGSLKEYAEDLSVARLLGFVGPLKDIASRFARLK